MLSAFLTARALRPAMIVLALAVSASCASSEEDAGDSEVGADREQVQAAAAFYPLAEALERVGGDRVEVTNLTPPGGGPHDLELTPRQVTDLADVDLVLYLSGGFQPQVEDAVGGLGDDVTVVDGLEGIDLLPAADQLQGTQGEADGEVLADGSDPHVWVDPLLQAQIAEDAHAALVDLDPDGAADFDAGLAAYQDELNTLDADYRAGLADCDSRVIVTSHRAFEYLARRHDLVQIAIAGITPDDDPDPRTLEAVADAARENDVQVIFFEEQVPPDLAETVADEIGASTDALDPVESITQDRLDDGATYDTIMRENLDSLTEGLGCS
ncbi:MAG: zinc ABC transporter substrate-binding protein [Acidimicrobiales bacterium]|nr:zinc ABC transporter substrate-binding protein [Acidimicrobiales bacterium]